MDMGILSQLGYDWQQLHFVPNILNSVTQPVVGFLVGPKDFYPGPGGSLPD